jgi:Ala-tRNA(Pro) deacylase
MKMPEPSAKSLHPVTRQITSLLSESGAWFETFEHEPVKTSVEAANVRADYGLHQGAKAIVIAFKRLGKRQFVMLVFPANRQFDKKRVRDAIGTREFRFASKEEVDRLTGSVISGGIPPFGDLFGLPVCADPGLFENERIIFNAGDRRFSVAMRSEDYRMIAHPFVTKIVQQS